MTDPNELKKIFLTKESQVISGIWSFSREHPWEISVLSIVTVILIGISRLPYLNIILQPYAIVFIVCMLAYALLRLSGEVILKVTLALFLIAALELLSGNETGAEATGNLIYFLMWFVSLIYLGEVWKKIKKRS